MAKLFGLVDDDSNEEDFRRAPDTRNNENKIVFAKKVQDPSERKRSYLTNSLIGILTGLVVFALVAGIIFLVRHIRNRRKSGGGGGGGGRDEEDQDEARRGTSVKYFRHTDMTGVEL